MSLLKLSAAIVLLFIFSYKIYPRLLLSLAKRKGLAGHRKLAKLLLSRIRKIELDPKKLLNLDNVGEALAAKRLYQLTTLGGAKKYEKSRQLGLQSMQNYSDAQLARKIGVPFLFSNLEKYLPTTPILKKAKDNYVYDVDGNEYIDFSNSLSNNYFGYQTQHQRLKQAIDSIESGAVLSNFSEATHQLAEKLKQFSQKDLVSLHMSGTEAVMQACGLARYNTGKDKIVTFTGSYHGWWDGVQVGVGSTRRNKDSIMLEQESSKTLRALKSRRDVAAVLVNPLHILFPNKAAAMDSGTFGKRVTPDVDEKRIHEYRQWLKMLQGVCKQKNIALIFDEVYVGHRLGWGGAQKYFDIEADITVYGKSFGCGLPIGIVCADEKFGRRTNDEFPFHFVLARGTFQGNPYVVAAAIEALSLLERETSSEKFQNLRTHYKEIAKKWNQAFKENGVPLSVSHFESIFTFNFLENSLFNWLLVYFLRDAGIYISTIPGLGRMPLPLNFSSHLADQALERILNAATQMRSSGFWGVESEVSKKEIVKLCMKSFLKLSV